MKFITLITFVLITLNGFAQQKNLYDFEVKDINYQEFDMSSLEGRKVVIVNVASKCGLTPQYKQLQELYDKYKDQNFIVIGFPCNDFREQEPGTNEQIKEFCTTNYGVTFPIMDKVTVKGDNKAPIYKWLTEKQENGVLDTEVEWNFQKFMIDENGHLVDFVQPRESPFSEKITQWIEE